MAVGFPSKVDFATGDVLSATNVNDISGTLNLVNGTQYSGGKNRVLNSAMQVWQRGTTFAVSNTSAYTADRWQARVTAVCTTSYSRQTTSDTTNLPNIQYNLRAQRTAAQTATPFMILEQSFESVNSIPLAGKTVVFSFYVRAGANYSGASNTLGLGVYTGTGTDQNIGSGFTGQTTIISQNPVLTTTWQRFTYTGTVAATATQIGISMFYQTVGTAGAADYFEVTGVQLEASTTAASAFSTNGGTYQAELAACQRYFQKTNNQTEAPGTAPSVSPINALNASSTLVVGIPPFKVNMRTSPTVTLYSAATGTSGKIRSGGADVTATAADVGEYSIGYISATGLVSGSNSTVTFTASAEL